MHRHRNPQVIFSSKKLDEHDFDEKAALRAILYVASRQVDLKSLLATSPSLCRRCSRAHDDRSRPYGVRLASAVLTPLP